MLLTRLILESFSFAFGSLKANKLRTLLSLLGITVGIFSIISVFTVIDSLERFIRKNLESLGSDMVYIQKWPWAPPEGESEYPWWRYMNRPQPTIDEHDEIIRQSRTAENAVFLFGFSRMVKQGRINAENVEIMATSHALIDTWSLEVRRGRYFTESESVSGANLAVLGDEVATRLFKGVNPVGKEIKIQGHRFFIIGVYKKMGAGIFGTSMDKRIHIPVNYAFNMIDIRNRGMGQTINVKAKPGVDHDEFIAELEGIMRSVRQLRPQEENDFAINETRLVTGQFETFFKGFNLAGWVIGGFSILVGGFGIANIMFVSVKERTKIIGIQKALGAKKYFILSQFAFEAIVLSLLGGIVGLIIVYIGSLLFGYFTDMTLQLTVANVLLGLLISAVIGFIAGFMPAMKASRLDPVTAINSI